MIRLKRPRKAPAILRERGARAKRQLCRLYDESLEEYQDGSKRFEFDSGIYADRSVKDALCRAQQNKCCFCESKVTHVAYGDIEHFRPKAGYRQDSVDPLGRPGYYWLAYSWTNLLFCCQLCNQRFKRNAFPLADPTSRAISHHAKVGAERPLFIDPTTTDPTQYLGFREQFLYAKEGSSAGVATIEALGLNREALAEVRLDHLKLLSKLLETRQVVSDFIANRPSAKLSADIAEIDALLEVYASDSAQYAAMTRAAFAKASFKVPARAHSRPSSKKPQRPSS